MGIRVLCSSPVLDPPSIRGGSSETTRRGSLTVICTRPIRVSSSRFPNEWKTRSRLLNRDKSTLFWVDGLQTSTPVLRPQISYLDSAESGSHLIRLSCVNPALSQPRVERLLLPLAVRVDITAYYGILNAAAARLGVSVACRSTRRVTLGYTPTTSSTTIFTLASWKTTNRSSSRCPVTLGLRCTTILWQGKNWQLFPLPKWQAVELATPPSTHTMVTGS